MFPHIEVVGLNFLLGVLNSPADQSMLDRDSLFHPQFNFRLDIKPDDQEALTPEKLEEIALERMNQTYEEKEERFSSEMLRQLEKIILLQSIDNLWKDHLLSMDHLKEGVGLRGYAQKNPLQEYQKEGFNMFEEMVHRIQEDSVQKQDDLLQLTEHLGTKTLRR